MAAEILQIKITADNKEALGAMRDTIAGLNGVSVAAGKSNQAIAKTSATTMNFSRVIQDLPFGFMGVQNNLTQLIPGIGAAGIAFSALTAAITFSQVGMSYWVKKSKEAKDAGNAFLEFTREANKAAGEEITKSKLLYQAANNLAIAMDKRLRAAKELKETYPDTFKNFTKEEIALGKAKNAYDGLAESIIKVARARAAEGKIGDIQGQILDREFNIRKIEAFTDKELADAEKKPINARLKKFQKEQVLEDRRNAILKRRKNAIAEENKMIGVLKSQQNFYEKFAGATDMQESVIPDAEKEKIKKATFDLKKYRQEMDGAFKESLFAAPEVFAPKEKPQKMEGGLPTSMAQIDKMITEGRLKNMEKIREKQDEDAQDQEQAILRQADLYMGVLTPAIDNMFNSLTNGESVLDSLGGMFEQLTKQIAASVIKAAALAAILSLIPGGNVAAGAGATAGFGDIFKSLLGFATGGTVSGPESGYPVMLHGTEHIVRPDQMKSIISEAAMRGMNNVQGSSGMGDIRITGEFKQRGQDMVAVIDRANVSLGLRRG